VALAAAVSLDTVVERMRAVMAGVVAVGGGAGAGQGLTLVHFSAQPELFLKQKHTVSTP